MDPLRRICGRGGNGQWGNFCHGVHEQGLPLRFSEDDDPTVSRNRPVGYFSLSDHHDPPQDHSIWKAILTHFRMQNFHQIFQPFNNPWTGTIEEIAINLKQLALLYRCQRRPPFP